MANNAWRTLNRRIQKSLSAPLAGIAPWYFKGAEFEKWFQRWYNKSVDRKTVYPEWYFNHQLSPMKRTSLLCVHAKMEKEGFWTQVKELIWIGDTGNLLFKPVSGVKAFHRLLISRGYGNWWLADWRAGDWGLRSRFCGCQLHFRGWFSPPKVEAHIDLHNPGDPSSGKVTGAVDEFPEALQHLVEDKWKRSTTHRPHLIRKALLKQGIDIYR